ncbi:RidA family protein [Govanella unica]|uniref:RidA family protein n=1 Tax=Govanella unica TaxID=2975056 RepID=A0A9X3Z7E2_9PROT|nr:RidA family protein [Govania unica]MDA5194145.1 RidA family protein [Govania unica]
MQKISSGSPFEALAGYSRAVVDDLYVHVSGTVGADPETKAIPEDAEAQTRNIFRIIEDTLTTAGTDLTQVTRSRVYVTDMSHLGAVVKVLGEKFGEIRPANTTLICGIPAPGAKVEIEVTARRK